MQPLRKSVLASAVAAAAVSLLAPVGAQATAPAPGNILVYRAGDGTTGQAANTASVWIDEYTTAGALVQSFAAPTTGTTALTVGATTTTEGGLSISTDGKWAVFTGYQSDAGTAGTPQGKAAAAAPRVIGRLNLTTGAMDTDTVITGQYTSSSIRGIASTDGTQFWTVGTSIPGSGAGSSGIVYTTGTGASAVSTNLQSTNTRGAAIYDDTLWISSSSRITKVNLAAGDTGAPGHPTLPSIGTTSLNAANAASGGTAFGQFAMFDLDATVPGVDTLYDAQAGNLEKYSLVGGTWTSSGTLATGVTGNILGLAGQLNPTGGVTLFFTTTPSTPATASSVLDMLTDTSGYNATLAGTVTNIATSVLNTTFRNVAVVPAAAAPPHFPGDTNNDGVVDLVDLNNVLNNFGATGTNPGDDNADGTVDLVDLNNVLNNFGATHAASALSVVPEPASLSLLALGATTLLARRRRHA